MVSKWWSLAGIQQRCPMTDDVVGRCCGCCLARHFRGGQRKRFVKIRSGFVKIASRLFTQQRYLGSHGGMTDVLLLITLIGAFAGFVGYMRLCERIVGPDTALDVTAPTATSSPADGRP